MRLLKKIVNCLFQNYSCYLYTQTPIIRNEADFLPGICSYSFQVITTPLQLEDLISAGFDLLHFQAETRELIQKGAAAGLIFVGKELASMEWVAMTERANKAINLYPLKIDFQQKEAYASGVWTNPKFRHKGLHVYVYYKVYDFLRENGITSIFSIVASDNLAAQKAHQRFSPQERVYGRARYLNILGIPFWIE